MMHLYNKNIFESNDTKRYFFSKVPGFDAGKVKDNIQVAQDLIKHVRDQKNVVPSWGLESPVTLQKKIEWESNWEKLHKLRKLAGRLVYMQPEYKQNDYSYFSLVTHIAKKSGVWACTEMAMDAFLYAQTIQYPGRIALFDISRPVNSTPPEGVSEKGMEGNGHVACMIGLGDDSKVVNNDERSYGVNAVVVDPWANQYYSVSEFLHESKNYYGLDTEGRNPTFKPVLAKIDPRFDVVQISCTNIFSVNEFLAPFVRANMVTPCVSEIVDLLHLFNRKTAKDTKAKLAHQMLLKIPKLRQTLTKQIGCRENVDVLYLQLQRFLDPSYPLFEI